MRIFNRYFQDIDMMLVIKLINNFNFINYIIKNIHMIYVIKNKVNFGDFFNKNYM